MGAHRHPAAAKQPTASTVILPQWTGPLVAELALASRADAFSAPGWLFELKYDGFRVQAARDGTSVKLRLRSGRDATAQFPEVVNAVASLPSKHALLDGELVAFGGDGRSNFEALRARAFATLKTARPLHPVTACFFDLLAMDHHDLRQLPTIERKRMLRELLQGQHGLVYVDHLEGRGEELLYGARKLGLEGLVAKKADSAYLPGRTGAWRKIKIEETGDFVVVGIADPSRATFMRPGLLLAVLETPGSLRYVGCVGVGRSELEALEPVVHRLRREAAPCPRVPSAAVWLNPALVCEVRYLASSRHGLRHAVFIRFRPDKPWRECRST